jgi:hypothetical protein
MASSTIDHLVAVTVFIAAMVLFIGLFNQTIQTAILYEQHRSLAAKCTDTLDNVLLNPGFPTYWGQSNVTPSSFGLQDPEFTQYRLSPFSLMRLNCTTGSPIYYSKTGTWYSNITMGFGQSLLVPYTTAITYPTASRLLSTNGTYGFQITISPIVQVSIWQTQANPLILSIAVQGAGFPLAVSTLSYCFITVDATGGSGSYPAYYTSYGTTLTGDGGTASLSFPGVNGASTSYLLIAYAHMSGLTGVGYYSHVTEDQNYVVPFISDFDTREIIIAHSYDVQGGSDPAEIAYNATFVLLTDDFTLREMPLDNSSGKIGKINYGEGKPYNTIYIPTYNPGILIITYRKSAQECGIVMMPWGLSSLSFPITFGDRLPGRDWVATDMRQVIVNGVAYQAKLALWSLSSYPVVG